MRTLKKAIEKAEKVKCPSDMQYAIAVTKVDEKDHYTFHFEFKKDAVEIGTVQELDFGFTRKIVALGN